MEGSVCLLWLMPGCAVNWLETSASGARPVISEYHTVNFARFVRANWGLLWRSWSIVGRNLRVLVLTVKLRILKVRCFKFFGRLTRVSLLMRSCSCASCRAVERRLPAGSICGLPEHIATLELDPETDCTESSWVFLYVQWRACLLICVMAVCVFYSLRFRSTDTFLI